MKQRFDFRMLLFTWVLSALGMILCIPLRVSLGGSAIGRAAWCALWFAFPLALGLVGVELGLLLNRRRFHPIRKRRSAAAFLAALLLGALLGGGGGILSMMEYRIETEIIPPEDEAIPAPSESEALPAPTPAPSKEAPDPTPAPPKETPTPAPPDWWTMANHIVMLIDASDSGASDGQKVQQRACQVIDDLNEEFSVQVAAFAYAPTAEDIRYRTDYLSLKDEVKEEFKEFIVNTDLVGGTSFDGPILMALETLKDESGSYEESAAIFLFSDGDGPLSREVYDAVLESEVQLYVISANPVQTPDALLLVQLAEATGGGRMLIVSNDVGLNSFGASLQSESTAEERVSVSGQAAEVVQKRGRFTWGEVLPPDGFGRDGNVWRIAVCAVTYILYAVLAATVYYRRITLPGLAGSLCSGCLTACVVTIDQRLCIPATVVLLLGAYTVYQEKEETDYV